MHILFVGQIYEGYHFRQRMVALSELGNEVKGIDTCIPKDVSRWRRFPSRLAYKLFRMGFTRFGLREFNQENATILRCLADRPWDVLWLDRALTIEAETLRRAKAMRPSCMIVGFSHDDMVRRYNQSRQFLEHLRLYDVFFTTKSYNVPELEAMGCKRCEYLGNAFDPHTHRPVDVSENDGRRKPVGFVGCWEPKRANSIRFLVESGIPVCVWGHTWKRWRFRHPLLEMRCQDVLGDQYAGALCSFDIALCFLRKANRDLQTTRSMEIPACGVFMLAERTGEHLELFEEGKEAEFFDCDEELVEKAKHYLAHPQQRQRIAAAGRRRCLESGYSHHDRLKTMLNAIERNHVEMYIEEKVG